MSRSEGFGKSVPGVDKMNLSNHGDIVIKCGRVENIGSNGKVETADHGSEQDKYLARVLKFAREKAGLTRVTNEDIENGETTRLLLLPLRATPAEGVLETLTGNRGGAIKADKTDVAVCWSYRATNVNEQGLSGQISGVAIMSSDSAKAFYEEVASEPERLFETVDTINGGVVRRQDGQPAEIVPGKVLVVLPNTEVGGKLREKQKSQPFANGFKPNQL